ncbi:phage minor head protein [Kistimonas scapharcae]|uniref:Phage minor head protein n=1 Tax=Kistimonas scapharcae TaxID=1036133 RepID=A0ABP8UYL2_9GAMM
MSSSHYDFLEVTAGFTLKPAQAIRFFERKGLKLSFRWEDMLAEEHDAAFTVAKMMNRDLLAFVAKKTQQAIDDGKTLTEFKQQLIPALQKAGWWGKQDVVDPNSGQIVKAQLGSASRLATIFRTNLQSAYSVGHWQSIRANAATAPYLMYDAVEDHRVRPEHQQWDGRVYPVNHTFWNTHFPPNGWNCRCGVIQLGRKELKAYGLKPSPEPKIKPRLWENPHTGKTRTVPEDLDPGWDHNPGQTRFAILRRLEREKRSEGQQQKP